MNLRQNTVCSVKKFPGLRGLWYFPCLVTTSETTRSCGTWQTGKGPTAKYPSSVWHLGVAETICEFMVVYGVAEIWTEHVYCESSCKASWSFLALGHLFYSHGQCFMWSFYCPFPLKLGKIVLFVLKCTNSQDFLADCSQCNLICSHGKSENL